MTDKAREALTALRYMGEGYDNHFNAGIPLMALHVAEVGAALAERDALNEAALHWLVSLKQEYNENGDGIRKWSEVYDECVANIKRLAACPARAEEGSGDA